MLRKSCRSGRMSNFLGLKLSWSFAAVVGACKAGVCRVTVLFSLIHGDVKLERFGTRNHNKR